MVGALLIVRGNGMLFAPILVAVLLASAAADTDEAAIASSARSRSPASSRCRSPTPTTCASCPTTSCTSSCRISCPASCSAPPAHCICSARRAGCSIAAIVAVALTLAAAYAVRRYVAPALADSGERSGRRRSSSSSFPRWLCCSSGTRRVWATGSLGGGRSCSRWRREALPCSSCGRAATSTARPRCCCCSGSRAIRSCSRPATRTRGTRLTTSIPIATSSVRSCRSPCSWSRSRSTRLFATVRSRRPTRRTDRDRGGRSC